MAGATVAEAARRKTTDMTPTPSSFLDLRRPPNTVVLFTEAGEQALQPATDGRWHGAEVEVVTGAQADGLRVTLHAPKAAVKRMRLRWQGDLAGVQLWLGDAWERAYGELEWRGAVPERVMPWYCGAFDGTRTHGYGVRTGANAFCFWQADADGLTLWINAQSGGVGVQLDQRVLEVCTVVCRAGQPRESSFHALHAFCQQMCPVPRLPAQPVYGHNDWYYAYGHNSAAQIMSDCQRIVSLSPTGPNRPFTVIDDGWENDGNDGHSSWEHGNAKFPDMAGLAHDIKQAGSRPGLWMRPLLATKAAPAAWQSQRDPRVLDPTVPEVKQQVATDVARLWGWGYELIKHDFSTVDILGHWGFEMGAGLTKDGWKFAEGQSRTSAEVVRDLYQTIRVAAGDSLVIGCNTVSHLSAGVFELCRIGDDTSGREWSRTRKMGVNCLAFRSVQSGAFYIADADCVGITNEIPWALNRQWLDLVARSGTTLFVSLAPDAVGPEQEKALRAALVIAAQPQPLGEALDWMRTIWPCQWRLGGQETRYDWVGAAGVSPF